MYTNRNQKSQHFTCLLNNKKLVSVADKELNLKSPETSKSEMFLYNQKNKLESLVSLL